MSRKPTLEELFTRMLEGFDEEIDPVLSMTPEEIRASLAADGYDVAAIEREARAFFGLKKRRGHLTLLASFAAPLALFGALAEAFAPVLPALPLAAAPSGQPVVTAAAPPLDTDAHVDGGSK